MFGAVGLSVTEATGRFATVTNFFPFFFPLVAVIVADPAATPVTCPLDDTVATALLLVVHVTVRPVSTFPFTSMTTALSCCVEPSDRFTAAGFTMTESTGTSNTVTVAGPVKPLALAFTTYPPGVAPAVYRPEGDIVPPLALQ